jgi:TM2 domain-containing membrane protein YozV
MRGTSTPSSPKRYATGKSPTFAVILSLILAGLGQFYNSDGKKGTLMLLIAVIGGMMTGGVVYLGVAVWSAVDSYFVASAKAPIW